MVELEGGVARSAAGREQRRAALDALYENFEVLPFTSREAELYGRIILTRGFARSKVIDRMIAATALAAGAPVVTLNPRDFREIPDLRVEDWSTS
jgi:tRNA(fMet)-specific endonuclease VapC